MARVIVRDGKTQYRLSQAKIRALKKKLKMAILAGHSLREMATSPLFYNNEITFQTLGRFIHERNYVPANYATCKALGIIADPNPYRSLPKWYNRTMEALNFFNTKRMQIKQMSDAAKAERRAVMRKEK